uniref:B30.2/SPRY domain-containing protein n=1 Tax=Astyanax mexicanus TaxID=7994 RepID=A0A3B1JVL5_ASTMX
QENTNRVISDSKYVFTALKDSITRLQTEVLEVMEEKQKAAERQAEDLEQEITELKRRDTELEQLSHTEDRLHLLQVMMDDGFLDDELIYYLILISHTVFLSEDVTLDPDTAHPNLILSDDRKQVRYGDKKQKCPDKPERFDKYIDVLGNEEFSSGRFYYEVQVRGKTEWSLGVVKESVDRKGEIILAPQNGFWTLIMRNGNKYTACAEHPVPHPLRGKPQKVGVFVDYEKGLVSFYDVEARSLIYSYKGQSFTEKLYPFFSPGLNDDGKNSAPLIITPVSNTE